jgi:RHS repeat-associated protein
MVYEPTYAGGVLQLFITYIADYFPYGKVLREYVNTGSGAERFLTTQHERDKETGLDYRGARFYDSDVARFLSLDPLASTFPSWSAYNYVVGNPVAFIDPDGREAKDWIRKSGSNKWKWDASINSEEAAVSKYGEGTQYAKPGDSYESVEGKITLGANGSWSRNLPVDEGYTQQDIDAWRKHQKLVANSEALEGFMMNYFSIMTLPLGGGGGSLRGVLAGTRSLFMRGFSKAAVKTGGRGLVNLTEETFSQALFKGAENVGGYSVYGTKGLVGNTFNRNIFLLEASGSKSLSGFRSFVGSLEVEAIGAGANRISIYGSSVINKGFLNPNIAKRFGYTFEQSGSGVFLQKVLK